MTILPPATLASPCAGNDGYADQSHGGGHGGTGIRIALLIRLGPVIGARAATHAIWGYIGALLIQRKVSLPGTLAILLPIHALVETGVVMGLAGIALTQAFYITGLGTALHHGMDSLITIGLALSMQGLFGKQVFRVR